MNSRVLHELHFIEDSDDEIFLSRLLLANDHVDIGVVHHVSGEHFCKALEAGEIESPVLVVVDLNLPAKKGTEVVRELNEIVNQEEFTIGICTGSEDPADKLNAEQVGAAFFVHKPLDLDCLTRICSLSETLALREKENGTINLHAINRSGEAD